MRKTWHNHSGLLLGERQGQSVIDCEACGYAHMIPLPEARQLEDLYAEEYFGSVHPVDMAKMAEDAAWRELGFADRLNMAQQFRHTSPESAPLVLDIGCGHGHFLHFMAKQGWQPLGIEPSLSACRFAAERYQLNLVHDFFTPQSAADLPKVDFIHCCNVLEHLSEPAQTLQLARCLLKPHGLMCVSVPNDFSRLQQSLRDVFHYPDWWVSLPEHINYFSFDSLEALLDKNGFTPLLRHTSFPMEMFLLMGQDYLADPLLGRNCHNLRKKLEENMEKAGLADIRRNFYAAMAAQGFGRECVVLASVNA